MTKAEWVDFFENKTLDNVSAFAKRYQDGNLSFETLQHEISFLYNIGLYYSEYYESDDRIQTIFRNDDKYYLAIYYYLKGIKLYEENKDLLDSDICFINEIIRRLYVNIGNEFSNQFRSINALFYFRRALEIDDCFDMAIGNFALGIEHHNPLIGLEPDKYCMVFNLLYDLYFDIHLDNLDSGLEFFEVKKIQYMEMQTAYINSIVQGKNANYDPYAFFTDIELFEQSYENWCVINTLYLNYLNDLGNYKEAIFDIDIIKLNKELGLADAQICSISNLFQLYILQRKKIYGCRDLDNDENLHELAQVFQCLYSYFDKVAFFVYKFFGLSGEERTVNINSIWNMKDADANSLLEYKNQYLYNIYWLRKEYRENPKDKMKINELLSPDAQDYANIRNTLEHREFSFKEIDGVPYINPELLYSKTLKLASVVRNMLLSLIQMVKTELELKDPLTNKRNMDLVYFVYEGFK